MVSNLLLVFPVTWKFSGEELLLVQKSPNQKRQQRREGQKPQYEPNASGVAAR
jgi:hypothetical protein